MSDTSYTYCLVFHCAHAANAIRSGTWKANIRQQGELITTDFGALNHVQPTKFFDQNKRTIAGRFRCTVKFQEDIFKTETQ